MPKHIRITDRKALDATCDGIPNKFYYSEEFKAYTGRCAKCDRVVWYKTNARWHHVADY